MNVLFKPTTRPKPTNRESIVGHSEHLGKVQEEKHHNETYTGATKRRYKNDAIPVP
jgi:hypothetical protein